MRRIATSPTTGGAVLLAATVVALAWASSPWRAGYEALWSTDLPLGLDLRHAVGDGLMALFFLVVGLEIKREVATGHLADRRHAALPVAAAVGGMVVPAALSLAVDGGPGWGIPMATDIVFALAVVAAFGDRVPASFRVLLLGLAVVDDIGAVAVIAVAYTDDLDVRWLVAAVGCLAVVALLWRVGVEHLAVHAVVATAAWWCTHESGVHATLAGVAVGLLTPIRTRRSGVVAERVERALMPWTSTLVIPLFALSHAGIRLSAGSIGDAAGSTVAAAVVVGLVVGKPLGIGLAVALSIRFGVARLPADLDRRHVAALGAVAGIGFTVSLLVADLAFDDDPTAAAQAKLGVLAASLASAAVGTALLLRATLAVWHRTGPRPTPPPPSSG